MDARRENRSGALAIDWTFDGGNEFDEMQVDRQWKRWQVELEGKIAELELPASRLRVAVEPGDGDTPWTMHAALYLPGVTLAAEQQGAASAEAFERLMAALADQIDRVQDPPVFVSQQRLGLEGIAAVLERWQAENRSDAFLSYLVPALMTLWPYIERELQLREIERTPSAAEIIPHDVVNEVLVMSWERFAWRDRRLPLDLWLIRLADEAMEMLCPPESQASIDDSVPAPRDDLQAFHSDEWDEWIEEATYLESVRLAELLPGGEAVTDWDDELLDRRAGHLVRMLAPLPQDRRQALILHAVLGFNTAEIADFQDRSVADVEDDIATGIAELRRQAEEEAMDGARTVAQNGRAASRGRRGRARRKAR